METVFFDIGANTGKWALANLTTNTSIIAVEASPTTFEVLKQDTQDKNITCLNYAVTDSSEKTVSFYESVSNTLSTLDKRWLEDPRSRFGINSPYRGYGPYQEITVNSITLDKLVATYGVPDLLKIDVEGAENRVIRSLTQKARLLCFEWSAEWNIESFECIDHLESLGYNRFHVQNGDEYTYRPSTFEHTSSSLKEYLNQTQPMIDWGMIWCYF
jgi:FkbM family methyltransferase